MAEKQIITVMYDILKAFKCKLLFWAKQPTDGILTYFMTFKRIGPTVLEGICRYNFNTAGRVSSTFSKPSGIRKAIWFMLLYWSWIMILSLVNLRWKLVELSYDTVLKQELVSLVLPFLSKWKISQIVFLVFAHYGHD